MLIEEELDLKERMKLNHITSLYFHFMENFDQLWRYERRLCEIAQIESIKESSKKIYNLLFKLRKEDPIDYKSNVFEIHPDGKISCIKKTKLFMLEQKRHQIC